MKQLILITFILFLFSFSYAQKDSKVKAIHVYVALCDNINQGIVPVPAKLGNGQDPNNNLYWNAMYGVKAYFKRSKDWTLISTKQNPETYILERILFKHNTSNTYLLADAYDGKFIKETTIDFLEASAGQNALKIKYNNKELCFGSDAQLLAYVGHDGLMEFNIEGNFDSENDNKRDVVILACVSKDYFKPYLEKTKANPLIWTTGLMAPEAYTLKASIDGWIINETNDQIRDRAAQAYHKYQKCGIRGARNLLVTGY